MTTEAHSTSAYIKIFWLLLVLTVVEVGIVYLGLPKMLLTGSAGYLRGVEGRAWWPCTSCILSSRRRSLAMIAIVAVRALCIPDPHAVAGYFPQLISVSQLPALNAALNTLSAVFLLAGYLFIRAKNRNAHRACMLAAFGCSTLFLVSYLVYHFKWAR